MKPRRISLPAYPFAREHYWIHVLTPGHDVAGSFEVSENMRSIEEIINRIGDEMMETEQAVKELKMLV